MPKYKKRADGRYQANIKVGVQENGKPKYKTLYGYSQRELETKLIEFRGLLNKGIIVDEKMSFSDWTEKWLEAYKSKLSHNTFQQYETCVTNHLLTAPFAHYPVSKITVTDIQAYLNSKADTPRTAQLIRMTLKQVFERAIENDISIRNPAAMTQLPKYTATPKRVVTPSERARILGEGFTSAQHAFLYIGLFAGLRRGEILALTRSDVDFTNNVLHVSKTVEFKGNRAEIKHSPKTDAGFRDVPMPHPLANFLKTYKYEMYLFTKKNGDIVNQSSYRRFWESIQRRIYGDAYLKDVNMITAHILRHTYATDLYYAGIDVKTAQKYLGHKDIKTTLEIYTHLEIDNKKSVEKLDSYFKNLVKF